jgi:nucleotide-binding universal stress UspA family protein
MQSAELAQPAPMRTNVVTVGVDGSPASMRAVEWAAAEAAAHGANLELVYALDELDELDYVTGLRQEAVATAAEAGAVGRFDTVTVRGAPAAVLLARCPRSQLLVLGDRGHGRVHEAIVGSVAALVMGTSPVPVVIVTEAWRPTPLRSVAVGVPAPPCGPQLVRFAFDLARAHLARVRAVRSWSELDWNAPVVVGADRDAVLRERAERELAEAVRPVAADFPEIETSTEVVTERAETALRAAARAADLLVLGRRDRPGRHLTRGRLAARLLHDCTAPVAVVPTAVPAPVTEAELAIEREPGPAEESR